MSAANFVVVGNSVLEEVIFSLKYNCVEDFKNDVKTVKEWMKKQSHLPEIMDDKRIQNFLILNKGRIEETKKKIDNYYRIRSNLTDVYEEINPKLPYMQNTLNAFYFVSTPKLTKENYRVFFYKVRTKNLLKFLNPILGLRYLVNLQEIRLIEDVMCGDIFVADGKNTPITALFYMTPSFLRKVLRTIYTDVFSNRLKAIYIINPPFFADKILFLFKFLLKPKLYNRIHIIKSVDALFEKLDKDIIPRDYGGNAASFQELQEVIRLKFQDYGSHFDKLDTLRVRDDLRQTTK